MTLEAAQGQRHRLVEKLAKLTIDKAGGNGDGDVLNSVEHWQDVGKYKLLNELLWDCDK